MKLEDARIIHPLMPVNDGNEDGSVDLPRWRRSLARVAYWQLVLNQFMERRSGGLMNSLLIYYMDYVTDPRYAERDPPTHEKIFYEHMRGNAAMKEYLGLVPKLGPAPDADGIDRLVQRMIDAAAGDGGPILREGNNMLPGSAGPRFSSDSTPTERLAWHILYHGDRGRKLEDYESISLWERVDDPREEEYHTVGWLHERVGGSLPTLYEAIRRLEGKGVIETGKWKHGMRLRLRMPYTFQCANDRASWCYLRDNGMLPIGRKTVVPGEPPYVQRTLNCQWLSDMAVMQSEEETAAAKGKDA